jgi:cytochrome c553
VEEAKPMALMMRAIYEQSSAMRGKVEAGEALDSSFYRFMEFHELEPTDSTVLVKVFYEHNEDFKRAFEDLLKASNKDSYNAMLTQCVSCHEDFCPGPIKRINKLRFQES